MHQRTAAAPLPSCKLATPVGILQISASDQGIVSVMFTDEAQDPALLMQTSTANSRSPQLTVLQTLAADLPGAERPLVCTRATDHLQQACTQLRQYFAGERQQFSLTLAPQGTDFQQQVWQALCAIPFAHSCSYGTIANHLQNPKAVRAVGAANGRNPIAIVVPCHRVIGANGSLTGYAGGLNRKMWLLQHELQRVAR